MRGKEFYERREMTDVSIHGRERGYRSFRFDEYIDETMLGEGGKKRIVKWRVTIRKSQFAMFHGREYEFCIGI